MKVGQIQRVKCPVTGEWVVTSECIMDNEPPKPKVKADIVPAEFIPITEGVWTIAAVDVVKGFPIRDKVTNEDKYMQLIVPIVKLSLTRVNWAGKCIVVTRTKGGVSLAYPNGDKTSTMGPSATIKTIKAKFGEDMGRHILDICDIAPPLPSPEPKIYPSYRTENVRLRAAGHIPLDGQDGKSMGNRPLVPVIHYGEDAWKTSPTMADKHSVKYHAYRPKV